MAVKRRIDVLLVERELAPTRSRAQALIMAGQVWVAGERVDKAGTPVAVDAELHVRELARYVSRGGDKLRGALDDLGLEVTGLCCLDVGASTGGFTDCLLQAGAHHVVAVDVGHGQLADRLRKDPRVECRERTNARHLQLSDFEQPLDLVVVDASFIGLEKLIDAIARVLPSGGRLLALIKPQFEAGRDEARRAKGVIRDPKVRRAAIESALAAVRDAGFRIDGSADCRVPGPKGNVEHFVLATRG